MIEWGVEVLRCMAHYTDFSCPVQTLTDREVTLLLKTSGKRVDGFRDHIIFSVALGSGLREHEIAALNVGDVWSHELREVRQRVTLPAWKGKGKKGAKRSVKKEKELQQVVLPMTLRIKLERFIVWKVERGEAVDAKAPLFVAARRGRRGKGGRISLRTLRHVFRIWQQRAGFERLLCFHSLRHTACSALYRKTKDLSATQRFARHRSILSTQIYVHASDMDMVKAVEGLKC